MLPFSRLKFYKIKKPIPNHDHLLIGLGTLKINEFSFSKKKNKRVQNTRKARIIDMKTSITQN